MVSGIQNSQRLDPLLLDLHLRRGAGPSLYAHHFEISLVEQEETAKIKQRFSSGLKKLSGTKVEMSMV